MLSRSKTHWIPPGARTIPLVKSQKNLRYSIPQNAAQNVSIARKVEMNHVHDEFI